MDDALPDDFKSARPSKFQFKSKRRRHHTSHTASSDGGAANRHEAHPFRRPRSPSPSRIHDPPLHDDTHGSGTGVSADADADAAFRESLFDAIADPEGAAYWERVYGQPLHGYARPKVGCAARGGARPEWNLEHVDDEKFARYVMGRMWERTHEHVAEERKRREEARKRSREEQEILMKELRERERLWQEVKRKERKGDEDEESRRWMDMEGEDTRPTWGWGPDGGPRWKRQKVDSGRWEEDESRWEEGESRWKKGESWWEEGESRWKKAWRRYAKGWEALKMLEKWEEQTDDDDEARRVRKAIPWPTETGRRKDVGKESTEEFFKNAPGGGGDEHLYAVLKAERVRWHPDKMQQRFGGPLIDAQTLKSVTAVFQVVESMWGELRAKK